MGAFHRIVFFGTPDFAVPTLEALAASGRRPLRVVSQPPRPAGRGRHVQPPPVASAAERLGLPVLYPHRVREPEFLEEIEALEPDLAVVVAFGQIFPARLLAIPRAGCINLHASLLPAYRGAAPIQAAIAAGEDVTGVSTMIMEEGLDSGPVLLQAATPIAEGETAGELSERLARLGADLVLRTLDQLEAGSLTPRPQDSSLATYAPRIVKEAGRVDWERGAEELNRLLRAFTPWPGLSTELRERPLKILDAIPLDPPAVTEDGAPGTFLGVVDGRLAVRSGSSSVLGLGRVQRPGRKAVSAVDLVNGERLRPGERFI